MRHIILVFISCGMTLMSYAQNLKNIQHKITSKYFQEQRIIQMHLPKEYSKEERLPVIYVFDAQWDTYFNLTTSTIDYLIEIKKIPKSIIVGIHSENRQFEFTAKIVNDNWDMPHLGGARFLEKHLSEEVIPLLNRDYNTENFRIGIGHSLGATFVLNSLIDSPSLFNAYISISPNLQIDDEEITLKIQRNIQQVKKLNKFLYTTIGSEGNPDTMFLPYVKKLDTLMQANKSEVFNWNFSILKELDHATTPIESIDRGLLELAKKWKLSEIEKERISKSLNVVKEFNSFYINLSKWTGYSVIPSKNDYYSFSGILEAKKNYYDAINIYKSAIEKFPSESRFYNCVAENMIKLENKKGAKTYLHLALKILKNETFEYADDKTYFEKLYKKNLEKIN